MTPLTPSNEMPPLGVSQDDWSLISKVALSTVGSQGTMGLALVLGVVSTLFILRMEPISNFSCSKKLVFYYAAQLMLPLKIFDHR